MTVCKREFGWVSGSRWSWDHALTRSKRLFDLSSQEHAARAAHSLGTAFAHVTWPCRPSRRVKPWLIQSFLIFDSVDTTLKCDHSLESCRAVVYFWFFNLTQQNSGLGTVGSERVKEWKLTFLMVSEKWICSSKGSVAWESIWGQRTGKKRQKKNNYLSQEKQAT